MYCKVIIARVPTSTEITVANASILLDNQQPQISSVLFTQCTLHTLILHTFYIKCIDNASLFTLVRWNFVITYSVIMHTQMQCLNYLSHQIIHIKLIAYDVQLLIMHTNFTYLAIFYNFQFILQNFHV